MKHYFEQLISYHNVWGNAKPLTRIINVLNASLVVGGYRPFKPKTKPIMAMIEPTGRCNMDCIGCHRKNIRSKKGDLTFDNFKKIINRLPDTIVSLYLFGLGEPTLNNELCDMIRYARERGKLTLVATNATALDRYKAEEISKTGLSELAISLRVPNAEVGDALMPNINFDEVVEAISDVVENKKQYNPQMRLSFWVTLMRSNLDYVPEFIQLAKEMGITSIVFQRIVPKYDYVSSYPAELKSQIITQEEELSRVRQSRSYAKRLKIDVTIREKKCDWPWKGVNINWEGYITPCCFLFDYKNHYIGNVLEDDFDGIWNSDHYLTLRKGLLSKSEPDYCVDCPLLHKFF